MPAGPAVLDVADELIALLDGTAAYLPLPPETGDPTALLLKEALGADQPIADDAALVIATSGTTGVPKGAVHTAATLRASARATARRLGGPGNWLLALPAHHIAGLQVLLRALAAGHLPGVLDVSAGFDVEEFIAAADTLRGPRRYTSLVPTQLLKVLESPSATKVLSEFDAVLIGGAATPPSLRLRAEQAGVRIVATYGMSETAGGCVYDGMPLDGVRVRITESGRVALGGPTVAHGYRNLPDHPSFAETGWFLTDDLGRVDDGVLSIIGRADEAISTGGLTVVPQVIEAVLLEDAAVAQCAVVGVHDERLGQRVVAVVVAAGDVEPTLDALAGRVSEQCDRFAAPRELFIVDALPMRGPGKVDRRALRAQLEG
ncbi:o-succinylbenzoate--CoA ligase [Gordonia effusa NBRC 100432]|uniref:O-succinylbenzoate--CoA ligase n=1 Tax=Gordonia effusa NBRC 100432 TaxID=1077974 RepID=H0QYK2_9ACTN|nr:o-succinylbenzoate--CoA ligase [Gordonia effusa]GAB17903.1 o-succinylbenzoate--CoA ligase [Gordonia effusa NBRC 100432]